MNHLHLPCTTSVKLFFTKAKKQSRTNVRNTPHRSLSFIITGNRIAKKQEMIPQLLSSEFSFLSLPFFFLFGFRKSYNFLDVCVFFFSSEVQWHYPSSWQTIMTGFSFRYEHILNGRICRRWSNKRGFKIKPTGLEHIRELKAGLNDVADHLGTLPVVQCSCDAWTDGRCIIRVFNKPSLFPDAVSSTLNQHEHQENVSPSLSDTPCMLWGRKWRDVECS